MIVIIFCDQVFPEVHPKICCSVDMYANNIIHTLYSQASASISRAVNTYMNLYTVNLEIFVVKIFSWQYSSMKIKNNNIILYIYIKLLEQQMLYR